MSSRRAIQLQHEAWPRARGICGSQQGPLALSMHLAPRCMSVCMSTITISNSGRLRTSLPGDAAYDVNVAAGANGMTCLTFNGETIRVLLTSASGQC